MFNKSVCLSGRKIAVSHGTHKVLLSTSLPRPKPILFVPILRLKIVMWIFNRQSWTRISQNLHYSWTPFLKIILQSFLFRFHLFFLQSVLKHAARLFCFVKLANILFFNWHQNFPRLKFTWKTLFPWYQKIELFFEWTHLRFETKKFPNYF